MRALIQVLRPPGAGGAPRHMKAVERKDAAPLRLDPEQALVVGALRHGEDAAGVGLEQHLGRDLEICVAVTGHGLDPAPISSPNYGRSKNKLNAGLDNLTM